jgi:hypothetical protein
MIIWFTAGLIFLNVCLHDIYKSGSSNKSLQFTVFEDIAGIALIINTFTYKRKKPALLDKSVYNM